MRSVREVSDESLEPDDGTVTVVGWTRPPRARRILAEYRAGADDQRAIHVGQGFIRVHVSGDRPVFTLRLLDRQPTRDMPGWRSVGGGAELFPGKRVSCTVDQSGMPGEIGLDLPEENMFFRVYTADPDDGVRQRFLAQFWPVNPVALLDHDDHLDEPGRGSTKPASEASGAPVASMHSAAEASPLASDAGLAFEWDGVVGLDYGQFQLSAGEWNDEIDEMAVLERALESGIAQDQSLLTIVVPHQNNFEMPLRIEVLSAQVPDDLDAWDEAFEASVDVDENGLRYESPTMGVTEIAVPAGHYRVLITGAGIVGRGWPGSTTPADSWRIRLAPVNGNVPARRLKAWTPPAP